MTPTLLAAAAALVHAEMMLESTPPNCPRRRARAQAREQAARRRFDAQLLAAHYDRH